MAEMKLLAIPAAFLLIVAFSGCAQQWQEKQLPPSGNNISPGNDSGDQQPPKLPASDDMDSSAPPTLPDPNSGTTEGAPPSPGFTS